MKNILTTIHLLLNKTKYTYVMCLVLLFLTALSCNQDDLIVEETTQELAHEGLQGFISFEELTQSIGDSPVFRANFDHFDVNRVAPPEGRGAEFVDAYIVTDEIHLIETEEINYYTLKLVNNNPNDKTNTFYNLIFEQHLLTGEVESKILQYHPELSWLFDKSQAFKGEIKFFDNNLITIDDLINGLDLNGESRLAYCGTDIIATWTCVNGHSSPLEHDENGVPCGGSWQFQLEAQPCPTDESIDDDEMPGGGDTNNDTGDGGGNTDGNDSTETVVLELCDGGLNDDDEGNPDDSEDCEDDYSAYFTPYMCGTVTSAEQAAIHNWAFTNFEDAISSANFLANNYEEEGDSDCAIFETLILFNEASWINYPCQRKIVDQAYRVCSPVTDLFQDIFEGNPGATVNFYAEPNLTNYGGADGSFAPEKINIIIGSPALGGSDLIIAMTAIHEIFHANLHYLLIINSEDDDPSNDFNIPPDSSPSYADLLIAFSELETQSEDPQAQHNFIVNFKNKLAAGVYTWATTQGGYSESELSLSDIENLAWAGLQSTTIWTHFVNNPENQDAVSAINFIISQETTNQGWANGNFCND